MKADLVMRIEDKIELTLLGSYITVGNLLVDINVKCGNLNTTISRKFKFKKYPHKDVYYINRNELLDLFTMAIRKEIVKYYSIENLDITHNIKDLMVSFIRNFSFDGKNSFIGTNRFGYEDIIINDSNGIDILLTNNYKEYDIIIPLHQVGNKPSIYAVNKNDHTQNLVVFYITPTGELDLILKGMHEYTIDEKLVDNIRDSVINDLADKILRPIPYKEDLTKAS